MRVSLLITSSHLLYLSTFLPPLHFAASKKASNEGCCQTFAHLSHVSPFFIIACRSFHVSLLFTLFSFIHECQRSPSFIQSSASSDYDREKKENFLSRLFHQHHRLFQLELLMWTEIVWFSFNQLSTIIHHWRDSRW